MAELEFGQRIIDWQRESGRHDLPWQKNVSPYRTWISEVMLQQTQVSAVIDYFKRFMDVFPDFTSLARADEDTVLHYWSGLGYYSRARNLLRTARMIVEDHEGRMPRDFQALLALPGIGRSTAGAILALSWGDRFPILDGNAKRVLARYSGIRSWPGERKTENQLWALAEKLLPAKDIAIYTQGIMDIGAILCRRNKPLCGFCPLQSACEANLSGVPQEFPGKKKRREIPVRSTQMLIIRNNHGYLLERRPVGGVWGGLWSFPEVADSKQAANWLRQRFDLATPNMQPLSPFRHTFSHFHLDVQPMLVETDHANTEVMDGGSWLWYNSAGEKSVGLAAPVKKLLDSLENEMQELS